MVQSEAKNALPRTPFNDASCWQGDDLADRSGWRFALSDSMRADLVRAASEAFSDEGDPSVEREHLPWTPPDWLDDWLKAIVQSISTTGVAWATGLPVDQLGEQRSARLYRAIGERMGQALTQNSRCEFLSPVFNEGVRFGYDSASASQGRGYRSQAQLNHHVDPTDVVGLLCIRKARSGGLSSIVSAAAVWNAMLAECPEHLPVLEAGFPYDRKGEEGPGEQPVTEPIPVFGRSGGRLDCRYARSYIICAAGRLDQPLSAAQVAALDAFDAIASRPGMAFRMPFEPGDIQWLDNLSVLHGRTAFEDDPDPRRGRMLLRLWLQMGDHPRWAGLPSAMRWAYARFGLLGRRADEDILDRCAGQAERSEARGPVVRAAPAPEPAVPPRVEPAGELPPELSGESCWKAAQWADPTAWVEPLSAAEIDEIEQAARAWGDRDLLALRAEHFPLPQFRSRIERARHHLLEGRGFVLWRGLPVARWGQTLSRVAFYGLGQHLGPARPQNAQGQLLGEVRDLGLRSSDPNVRIYQTAERQSFHTDSCDVVGLLCLAQARLGGESALVSSQTLWNEIRRARPDLAAVLLEPIATDRRGEVAPGEQPFFMIPVFNWHQGRMSAIYHRPYIESAQRFADAPRLTPLQIEALDLLDQRAHDPAIHFLMRLEPGDIQWVHNHTLFHDRMAFEDWPEPERRRHLLRLWLAPLEARPLPDVFAERYGCVEPGRRGGVMAGERTSSTV